MQTQRKRWVLK